MKITAVIKKTFDTGKVRAIADVTLDGAFAIHGLKLIEGDKGMFVSMPYSQWKDKDGSLKNTDIVHPITADARSELYHAVHDAYKAEMAQTEDEELPFGMSI